MLDTLKIADILRDAGFNEQQARAIADVQKQAVEEGGLATKADIIRLEGRTGSLEERIDSLEKLIKTMFSVVIALILPILLKLFIG